FLSLATNHRTDEYGGSIEKRAQIIFKILDAVKEILDSHRIAIKFTPVAISHVGIMKPDVETISLFQYILKRLNDYDLAYLHIVGPSEDLSGTPVEVLQDNYFSHFRNHYSGRLMANMGFSYDSGNAILNEGTADLVSFGIPFIANPDLIDRFKYKLALAEPDRDKFYAGDDVGYTDYPQAINT
ncbi:MAG: alkene reductase, partial [Chitinophagaceae bacterium]